MRASWWLCLVLVGVLVPAPVFAFGGVLVRRGGSAGPVVTEATRVVLARDGEHTVMTLHFDVTDSDPQIAIVVPVPSPVGVNDVRALNPRSLETLDRSTSPVLYDYAERDPCWNPGFPTPDQDYLVGFFSCAGCRGFGREPMAPRPGVETRFAAGQYDITVLDARASRRLVHSLEREGYSLPDGFEEAAQSHVERGDHFVIARVAPDRVERVEGRVVLAPLRIHFTSDRLELPMRLGALNGGDERDLVVHVISRGTRYEAVSHPHVTMPTHYRVDGSVAGHFENFYDALFSEVLERNPGAFVTEWVGEGSTLVGLGGPLRPEHLYAMAEPLMTMPRPTGRRAAPVLTIHPEDVRVEGDLHRAHITSVLRHSSARLARCWQQQDLSNGEDPVVQLTIAPSGALASVRVTGNTESLRACLEAAMRRVSFSSPADGEVVQATARIDGPSLVEAASVPVIDDPWDHRTQLVVTRLHYRHTGGVPADLVLSPAEPITGGTYAWARGGEGPWLVRAARPHSRNAFEARYFIGHPWEEHISCGAAAVRGAWQPRSRTEPAADAPAIATPLALEDAFVEEVPELGLAPRVIATFEPAEEPPIALAPVGTGDDPVPERTCGCRAVGANRTPGAWLVLLLFSLLGAGGRAARR